MFGGHTAIAPKVGQERVAVRGGFSVPYSPLMG
jgi:hypothetical protein